MQAAQTMNTSTTGATAHKTLSSDLIAGFNERLQNHPVYAAVETIEDLQVFMQHHVYSVWDFMSLIKYLQSTVAPTRYPWTPQADGSVCRFINELVLEEESDVDADGNHGSHFELYQAAMREIGADAEASQRFIDTINASGLDAAMALDSVPEPSRRFTTQTFAFINSNQAHEVAAALALGREHIIPGMFRSILARTGVDDQQAPIFHYYLNRHIHLDEDFHAPLSLRLLNSLCEHDPQRIEQAEAAANTAVTARLAFWDGVLEALESR